mgnify:CR=1 FL=1
MRKGVEREGVRARGPRVRRWVRVAVEAPVALVGRDGLAHLHEIGELHQLAVLAAHINRVEIVRIGALLIGELHDQMVVNRHRLSQKTDTRRAA